MIKFTIAYPYAEGTRFDHDYYRDTHIPLAKKAFGPACVKVEIDRGIGKAGPGEPTFHAMAHLYFETLESFQAALAAGMGGLASDVPNYTDTAPVAQLSEVVE